MQKLWGQKAGQGTQPGSCRCWVEWSSAIPEGADFGQILVRIPASLAKTQNPRFGGDTRHSLPAPRGEPGAELRGLQRVEGLAGPAAHVEDLKAGKCNCKSASAPEGERE